MEQQSSTNNNLIFFVLPNQIVNLSLVSSSSQIYQSQIQPDNSLQGTVNALKYRFPLRFLGVDYKELVVPCIPAKQLKINPNYQDKRTIKEQIPFFIKNSENSNHKGYASGKRSAIFKNQKQFLRYKGCGNFLQGFTVQKNEPRGCHYFHTAKRQLFMTNKINQILQKQIGVSSGNIPKLAFQYQTNEILKLNLKCESQMIGKYCCIFSTLGDRRIGTHIISPLQILFLNLCNLEQIKWFQLFEQNKRIDSGQPIQFLANWLFLQPGQHFLTQLSKLETNRNFITLEATELKIIETEQKKLLIEKVIEKLVKNKEQKEFVKNYLNNLTNDFEKIVNAIVQKIGYEMGEIKRIFCDYQINWGYYTDHGSLYHCNAHLNNFISTIPKANSQFLVPLDFDLAFFKNQFIRIDLEEECVSTYGKFDNDQFENFLCCEYQAMQMSVSGIQVMSNFKYSIEYDEKKEINPLSSMKMARIAFRDTLLKSFRSGMRKNKEQKERINKQWNQLIDPITHLIRVCLTISQDFQT